jgi:hypothetical protein
MPTDRTMHPLTSLPTLTIVVITVCSACAARTSRSSACEPVPEEFALPGQTVYRDCNVDRKSRLQVTPTLQHTPSPGQTCARAVVDVVVDSTGQPVQTTARVVRSTDPAFGLAVLNSLGDMRYEPAVKGGRPVPQLVRVDRAIVGVQVAVPTGTPPSSVRPPRQRPPRRPPC